VLRSDGLATLLTIARGIGWAAEWRTGRSRPTIARLMEVSGRSRRTVQYWCRWLEDRDLLTVLEPGTTPQFRPAILRSLPATLGSDNPDEGNLAREWVLTLPPSIDPPAPAVHQNCTPPRLERSSKPEKHPDARAREAKHPAGAWRIGAATPHSPSRPPLRSPESPGSVVIPWPPGRKAQRRPEALAACASLRAQHPVLARLSARGLRSQLRAWLLHPTRAYTPADILWALEHHPDGTAWHHGEPVRQPASWIRHRLSTWLGEDGEPVPPRSAQLFARAEAGRQAQAAEWARLAQQLHPGGDSTAARAEARRIAAAAAERSRTRARPGVEQTHGLRMSGSSGVPDTRKGAGPPEPQGAGVRSIRGASMWARSPGERK